MSVNTGNNIELDEMLNKIDTIGEIYSFDSGTFVYTLIRTRDGISNISIKKDGKVQILVKKGNFEDNIAWIYEELKNAEEIIANYEGRSQSERIFSKIERVYKYNEVNDSFEQVSGEIEGEGFVAKVMAVLKDTTGRVNGILK